MIIIITIVVITIIIITTIRLLADITLLQL